MFGSFNKTILLVVLLAALGTLSACGQKGPLYLPDEEQAEEESTS